MFVKQIDLTEALRLASKGVEVLTMAPDVPEPSGWTDYSPDTLQGMLDGCLFFRTESAMERPELGRALGLEEGSGTETDAPGGDGPPDGAPARKRRPVDMGKLMALHKAGWALGKIAEELKVSQTTVRNCLKKAQGGEDDEVKGLQP